MRDASIPWITLFALGAVHGINPAMGWLFAVGRGLQEYNRRALWRAFGPLAVGHALSIAVAIAIALSLGKVMPLVWLRWVVAASLLAVGIDGLRRHRHVSLGGMRVSARELATWSFLMASAHGAGLMVLPIVVGQPSMIQHNHASSVVIRFPSRAFPPVVGDSSSVLGLSHEQPSTNDEAQTTMHGERVGTHATENEGRMTGTGAHATEIEGRMTGSDASVPGLDSLAVIAALIHTLGYLAMTVLLAVVVYEKVGLSVLRRAWINVNVIWSGALIAAAVASVLG